MVLQEKIWGLERYTKDIWGQRSERKRKSNHIPTDNKNKYEHHIKSSQTFHAFFLTSMG